MGNDEFMDICEDRLIDDINKFCFENNLNINPCCESETITTTKRCQDGDTQNGDDTMPNPQTLYKVIDEKKELYGTWVANTADGKILLSMKGKDDEFKAFKPTEIEEVRPWTFSTKCNNTSGSIPWVGVKDCVSVGDLLVSTNGDFHIVTKTNTKANTTASFKGRRIVGEAIDTTVADPTES